MLVSKSVEFFLEFSTTSCFMKLTFFLTAFFLDRVTPLLMRKPDTSSKGFLTDLTFGGWWSIAAAFSSSSGCYILAPLGDCCLLLIWRFVSELLSMKANCSAFDFCSLNLFHLGLEVILLELFSSCWLFLSIKLVLSLTSGEAFMDESAAFDKFFDAVMVWLFALFFINFFFFIGGVVSCWGSSSPYVCSRLLYWIEFTTLGEMSKGA